MASMRTDENNMIEFVINNKHEESFSLFGRDDDDDNSVDNMFFGFRQPTDTAPAGVPPCGTPRHALPKRKMRRNTYGRKAQTRSLWWLRHLAPEVRDVYIADPHGREATKFRRLFRVPFALFLDLVAMARERWWRDWSPQKVDASGRIVSNLELKILGCLFVLGTGCCQFIVSTQSNISEEVHRKFFLAWTSNISHIKEEFVYMPKDDARFQAVVGEYGARGLPGCVGSVDCVHIAWDRCPKQYHNMYKGKEGFPSIAYEVICTAKKFIQSVTFGHPGSRNDKHIVKTDHSVMQLLEGNGWLQSRAWKTVGPNREEKVFFGAYLICDGGYHRWPCLVSPVKAGIPGSPVMKWSAKVESVRKDIEGVFGILKIRWRFLKNFNYLHQHSAVDNCFATCCVLHNLLLQHDGYLDPALPPFPGGVEEKLSKRFGNAWNGNDGIWNRFDDDTIDTEMERENRTHTTTISSHALAISWSKVIDALVDHHEFGGVRR
jgi:hypothetical protein